MSSRYAYIVLLIIASLLAASNAALASPSLTDVQASDKSVEYLHYLFGSIAGIITGGVGPNSPDSILGALSEILNASMLIFTGFVIFYVFVIGVLNTANEGTPLGKLYNSMWIPLRMVLALALVLPFAGGYSTMQIGVIWMAGNGIGIANSTWNRGLDHISSSGTLYPPALNVQYENIGKSILNSRVCMHGINDADKHINIEENPIEKILTNTNDTMAVSGDVVSVEGGSHRRVQQSYDSYYNIVSAAGAYTAAMITNYAAGKPWAYGTDPCGSFVLEFKEIDSGTGLDIAIINFQNKIITATATLDQNLDPLSIAIVLKASDVNSIYPDPDLFAFNDAIKTFQVEYEDAVSEAIDEFSTAKRIQKWSNGNPDIAGSTIGARDGGWITAGAWYWEIQRVNRETQAMVDVQPEFGMPTPQVTEHSDYHTYDSALQEYFSEMMVTDQYGSTVSVMERSSYSEDNWSLNFILKGIKTSMDYALTNPDPVSGISNIGHSIILIVEAGYLLSLPVYTVATVANEVITTDDGGAIAKAFAATAKAAIDEGRRVLFLIAILLFPMALFLAFYLPATPMIIWIMAVAGWFVLLIEAVIAAPIWAASHAMPEGDGFVGQRAMAGYMVMLSLFLRPTLMIFGFFAAMLLMIVMGKVVSLLFIPAMSSMNADHLSGLLTLFAMLAIFTSLIIQIAHRSYGLIHEVPDKVLRYIGGGAENLGEASHEQQSRSSFVGGVAKSVESNQRSSHMNKSNNENNQSNDNQNGKSGSMKKSSMGGAAMSKMAKMLSPNK